MSQDPEKKYLYFNVGLIKNSFALDALWQDALQYHMIDQPGKLIALRLTEYYEMIARGISQPGSGLPSKATGNGDGSKGMTAASSRGINGAHPMPGQVSDYRPDDEGIVAASPDADENADEAAEYWSSM